MLFVTCQFNVLTLSADFKWTIPSFSCQLYDQLIISLISLLSYYVGRGSEQGRVVEGEEGRCIRRGHSRGIDWENERDMEKV